jgi:hypothetical protein
MGRLARALDWRLRPPRHLHQHLECFNDGLLPDITASNSAKTAFPMIDSPVTSGDSQMHKTDRFARCRATGPRNARDRDSKIDVGMLQRAERHGDSCFLADSPKGLERRGLNPKHRVLGFIGISDEAAINDIRRARDISQRRCHHAPGAGFCRRNCEFAHPA